MYRLDITTEKRIQNNDSTNIKCVQPCRRGIRFHNPISVGWSVTPSDTVQNMMVNPNEIGMWNSKDNEELVRIHRLVKGNYLLCTYPGNGFVNPYQMSMRREAVSSTHLLRCQI